MQIRYVRLMSESPPKHCQDLRCVFDKTPTSLNQLSHDSQAYWASMGNSARSLHMRRAARILFNPSVYRHIIYTHIQVGRRYASPSSNSRHMKLCIASVSSSKCLLRSTPQTTYPMRCIPVLSRIRPETQPTLELFSQLEIHIDLPTNIPSPGCSLRSAAIHRQQTAKLFSQNLTLKSVYWWN